MLLEKVSRRKATLNTPFINAKTPLEKSRRKAPNTAKPQRGYNEKSTAWTPKLEKEKYQQRKV